VTALLPTKFYIPPLPAGFVARPQLLVLLDQALSQRLTLVSAPAGAGKTTTVAAWAHSRRGDGALIGWLSLDANDNEPVRFLDYLEGCLEECGLALDATAFSPALAPQDRLERLLADLGREKAGHKPEIIIVLDDVHFIQNRDVHRLMEYLIARMPPRLHLVVLTRSDPPLELARLRAAGQLAELRMQQLRFSTQEAGVFLSGSAGYHLAEEEIAALNERTEGWVAGLKMASISLRGREDASAFVATFAGSHRYIFDYLLEQVLDRQPPDVRSFLLKTSLLERFSAPLCDAILEGDGEAHIILDQLERENLFLIPLDDERGWYRYHCLFADLLQLILEQTYPGMRLQLHRRASQWYEAQGLLLDALQHALAAGDMELAAHIVSGNMLLLIEQDDVRPALLKIAAASSSKTGAHPWLDIAQAWVLVTGKANTAGPLLDVVEASIAQIPDMGERWRLLGQLSAVRAFVYSTQGDKANTVIQARQALAHLPPNEAAVRALTLATWGDVLSVDGHDPEAIPILEQAWGLARQAEKPQVAMMAAVALASAHLGAGRLHQAARVCSEALAIADACLARTLAALSATSGVYALLARIVSEWGENERAIHFARKGLLLSERWGQADMEVLCLVYLGRALVMANAPWEQAGQVFQRVRDMARCISPWELQMAETITLEALLDFDPPDQAEIKLQLRRVQDSGAHCPAPLQARILLYQGASSKSVLAMLNPALAALSGQPSFDLVRLHVLRALALQAAGDDRQSLDSIRAALELAEPENRVATFVREGAGLEKLLRRASTHSIYPAFVRTLLAAFEARRKPKVKMGDVSQAFIEPLSQRELEVLQYLGTHLSTPEIAGQMVVSANTVRTHIKNIYNKLGVHGRSAAIHQAKELGLLT